MTICFRDSFTSFCYDTVVWLAAVVGDAACAVNEELTESVNYDSVKWLVDSYKGKIVFASTCSVYGINNDLLDEKSSTNPKKLYFLILIISEKITLECSPLPKITTFFFMMEYYNNLLLIV